jgi:hypothetical protein
MSTGSILNYYQKNFTKSFMRFIIFVFIANLNVINFCLIAIVMSKIFF